MAGSYHVAVVELDILLPPSVGAGKLWLLGMRLQFLELGERNSKSRSKSWHYLSIRPGLTPSLRLCLPPTHPYTHHVCLVSARVQ